jgi:20S proteasome subunit beta 2
MGSNAGGFNFDNCKRNSMLEHKGVKPPSAWKTGTTIVGVVYKVCVVVCLRVLAAFLSWRERKE